VDEFLRTLVTHRAAESVTLARPAPFQEGYALVVNGNEFASRGRWDEAIAAWEQAAARNPENDAALYNLSLAHLSRQEFRRAESYAIRALNIRHNETYQAGLQRIRQQASVLDQADSREW
jgi:tetratricopeptide (TPR) repeat protein